MLVYNGLLPDAFAIAAEASWIFADKIIQHRGQDLAQFPNYSAGSMGPVRSFELLARDGRKWRDIGYEESAI